MKKVLFALVLMLCSVGAWGASQQFGESTSVLAVEVPVQVNLNGQPVRDLKLSNFELYDGRDKQQITGFEIVDLKVAGASSTAANEDVPIAGRRHFLMLFDLANSEPTSILRARRAAADVVAKLQPSDLVAVSTYSKMKGPQLVLGFTGDRKQIAIGLDSLGMTEMFDRSGDPLALAIADLSSQFGLNQVGMTGSGGTASGGVRDQDALENYRDAARASDKAERNNKESEIDNFTRSMGGLAQMMSSVSGRKYVVFLSEGFANQMLTGQETEDQETQTARENGEVWKLDSEKTYGSSGVQNNLQRMIEEFRRDDCIIQSVDIGGLKAGGDQQAKASGRDSLFTMAKDTGGDMYEHFNDLSQAMGQMLDRTSVTYVLTFQPQSLKADGKFRKLSVKLKDGPRGAEISYRQGYYAPKPFAQLSGLERRLRAADLVMGGDSGGDIPTAVLAVPFQLGGAKAFVPVVVEIDGKTLLAGVTGDVATIEVYAYAIDKSGGVAGFQALSLGLDLKKMRPAIEGSGIKFVGHVDVPPGEYTLRTVIRNGQTGAHSVSSQRLSVPAAEGGGPSVSQPIFIETPGKWVLLREPVKEGAAPPPYPFLGKDQDQPFIPAAAVRVSAESETPVCVMARNLGDAALAAQTEMTDAQGNSVSGGRLKITQRVKSTNGADRLLGVFQVQGLAAGRYTLRLLLKVGDATVESLPIAVEVVAGVAAASSS
ncbi:MAG: VWA domain-containing protein [Acidobacteriota bacterium]